MSMFAPRSPYESAWQQWNYGGGASRGEPMPRAADFPPAFEGQPMLQGSAPMPNSPMPMPQQQIPMPQGSQGPYGPTIPMPQSPQGPYGGPQYGGSSPMSPQMDRGRMAQGSRGQMRPMGRQSLGSVNRKGY